MRPQLTHIDVFTDVDATGNKSLLRTYYFSYADSSAGGLFRMTSVQEFGSDAVYTKTAPLAQSSKYPTPAPVGSPMPSTSFSWSSDEKLISAVRLPKGGLVTPKYLPIQVSTNSVNVLSELTISSELAGAPSMVTAFDYTSGAYRYGDSKNNASPGFSKVKVTSGSSSTISETEFETSDLRWGLPTVETVRDGKGDLISSSTHEYLERPVAGAPSEVKFVYLGSSSDGIFDGNAISTERKKKYYYDFDQGASDVKGNLVETDDLGILDSSGIADPVNLVQEKYSYIKSTVLGSYMYRVNKKQVYSADLAGVPGLASETRYYFDGSADYTQFNTSRGLPTRVESMVTNASGSPTFVSSQTTYDSWGNVLTTIDPSGNVTSTNVYDNAYHALLVSSTDARGLKTTINSRDHLLPNSTSDAGGNVSLSFFDVFGRETSKVLPFAIATGSSTQRDSTSSPSTQTVYNDVANLAGSAPAYVLQKVKVNSSTYLHSYSYVDGLGRTVQTKETAQDGSGKWVTVDTYYDNMGRVYAKSTPYLTTTSAFDYLASRGTDTAQKKTKFTFDALGRTLTVTNPDNTVMQSIYDQTRITTVDPKSHVVQVENLGRVQYTRKFSGTYPKTDADPKPTLYSFSKVVTARGKTLIFDSSQSTITTTFDMLGRKTSYQDQDMGTWNYAYYPNGTLKEQQDAAGNVISFDYDAAGRVLHKYYGTLTAPTQSPVATYVYGSTGLEKGLLKSVTLANGDSSVFAYDSLGRTLSSSKKIGTFGTRTEGFTYDDNGRLWKATLPSGEVLVSSYSVSGQQSGLAGSQTYLTGITLDGFGRTTNQSLGNTTSVGYTYDPVTFRLTDIVTTGVLNLHFAYDAVGNILTKTDRVLASASETFRYDDMNRLSSATGLYGARSYKYDIYNNLLGMNDVEENSIAGAHRVAGNSTSDFLYDANGNIVAKVPKGLNWYQQTLISNIAGTGGFIPGGYFSQAHTDQASIPYAEVSFPWAFHIAPVTVAHSAVSLTSITEAQLSASSVYRYDQENRLIEAAVGRNSTKYTYSDTRQRSTMTVGSDTTVFWFADYEETFSNGTVSTKVSSYFAQGRQIAKRTVAGSSDSLVYLYQDQLGSTSKVRDSSGTVTATYYEPFGKVYQTSVNGVRQSFTGQEWDASAGLMYYKARFYDAALGRFVQPDSELDGLNRYTYCGNNPVFRIDPSGNDWFSPIADFLRSTGLGIAKGISYFLEHYQVSVGVGSGRDGGYSYVGINGYVVYQSFYDKPSSSTSLIEKLDSDLTGSGRDTSASKVDRFTLGKPVLQRQGEMIYYEDACYYRSLLYMIEDVFNVPMTVDLIQTITMKLRNTQVLTNGPEGDGYYFVEDPYAVLSLALETVGLSQWKPNISTNENRRWGAQGAIQPVRSGDSPHFIVVTTTGSFVWDPSSGYHDRHLPLNGATRFVTFSMRF